MGVGKHMGSVPGAAVPSPAIQTTMAYTRPSDRHSGLALAAPLSLTAVARFNARPAHGLCSPAPTLP
jgi:hypothetical protein